MRDGVHHRGRSYNRSTIYRWENKGVVPNHLKLIWAVTGVSWKWLQRGEGLIDEIEPDP